MFPAGARLAGARLLRRICSRLLLMVGASPGHGGVRSRQEASKCIIWAFMSKSVLEVSHKPKKTPARWFSRLPKPPWRYPSPQYRWCLLNATAGCRPCSFLLACRPHREGNSAPWCPWSASQPYTFRSKVTTQLGNRGGLKALKPNSGFFKISQKRLQYSLV